MNKNNINKEILLVLLGMIIVTLILLCVRYYNRDKVISEKIRKNEIKKEKNERLEGDILKYANIFNEKSKVKKKEEKIYNNKKIKTYIFESGNKIEIYDDGRIKNYININELEAFKAFEKK